MTLAVRVKRSLKHPESLSEKVPCVCRMEEATVVKQLKRLTLYKHRHRKFLDEWG